MNRYYRIVLINNDTNEREMIYAKWTNRKKAIEWATEYITSLRNAGNNADFEIKTM